MQCSVPFFAVTDSYKDMGIVFYFRRIRHAAMMPPMAPDRWPSHEMFASILLLSSGGSAPNKIPPYIKNTKALMMADRQLRRITAAVTKKVTKPKITPLAPI